MTSNAFSFRRSLNDLPSSVSARSRNSSHEQTAILPFRLSHSHMSNKTTPRKGEPSRPFRRWKAKWREGCREMNDGKAQVGSSPDCTPN
mmetsp:Transcript_18957/g.30832  ORF Transcript_18957/g.30832 Transcript_18957/m.30832 type:complete len:89 (-) Transcript_18957:12-278(-)